MVLADESTDLGNMFCCPTDSVIISILEGTRGWLWTDNTKRQAFAFDGLYGYLDGDITEQFLEEALIKADSLKKTTQFQMIPQNDKASEMLNRLYAKKKDCMQKKIRYLMEEPVGGFDRENLEKIISTLPKEMTFAHFNQEYFNTISNDEDLRYITEGYDDFERFKNNAIGYLIVEDKNIVASALSYSKFKDGIEIKLMTNPPYRGRNMATIVVAKLLLYCAENNMRVIWDASNLTSVSIAKKMGYIMKKEYDSYIMFY